MEKKKETTDPVTVPAPTGPVVDALGRSVKAAHLSEAEVSCICDTKHLKLGFLLRNLSLWQQWFVETRKRYKVVGPLLRPAVFRF